MVSTPIPTWSMGCSGSAFTPPAESLSCLRVCGNSTSPPLRYDQPCTPLHQRKLRRVRTVYVGTDYRLSDFDAGPEARLPSAHRFSDRWASWRPSVHAPEHSGTAKPEAGLSS